jgi:radical SAM superfamily enzyme YgiQ (UPF0313 family)
VLTSDFVDYVIRSQGEQPLVDLLAHLRGAVPPGAVGGLSWKEGSGRIAHNPLRAATPLDDLPDLPYARVDMKRYIHPTYLGRRTVAHNSSFGCPFACSFCAVVAMSHRRWIAQSPERVERAVARLVRDFGVDAVQMHDMDFFISEARAAEIATRLIPFQLGWWGLGRIDTLMHYADETWRTLASSGLRMVFCGAESASDARLAAMNKGGTSSARLAIELAGRLRSYGVVPEYSFVLGSPPDPLADLEETFEYIREIKRVNPATEVMAHDAPGRRHPVARRRRAAARAELRAGTQRVLPHGHRSTADAGRAAAAAGDERLALLAEAVRRAVRASRAAPPGAVPAARHDGVLT